MSFALLLGVTNLPPTKVPAVSVWELSLHFGPYALLTVLPLLALGRTISVNHWSVALRQGGGATAVVTIIAILHVATQPLVGRHFSWLDWGADTVATLLIVGLVMIVHVVVRWVAEKRVMKAADRC